MVKSLASKKEPLISVVIPSYKAEQHIERCLQSVIRQKIDAEYEIIVVDSSRDGTPAIIQSRFPGVRLIHREQQTYPGAARNLGAQAAKAGILAFIDSDCIAAEDWLAMGLQSMQEGYKIVGGSVWNANPESLVSVADYILTFNEFVSGMPSRTVLGMPSCNLFCSKEVFEEVGGFDDGLRVGEDTLFCHKANKDYPLLFNPQCLVNHTNRTSFRSFLKHHHLFGEGSAKLRKSVPLSGAVFVNYPILTPVLPFARFVRIAARMTKGKMMGSFLVSSPLVFLGVCSWSWGFMKESWRR